MVKVRVLAVTIILVALGADQLSKVWAVDALGDGTTVTILSTVELDLVYNSGFSFSTGTGYGQLIGAVVLAISAHLARLVFRETSVRRGCLLAVILAGALGNLCDRLLRANEGFLSGEVVDFIDISWFAVFNIADICAVGGTALFAMAEIIISRGDRQSSESCRHLAEIEPGPHSR